MFNTVFTGGSDSEKSACNAADPGLIPGLETSPRTGNGNLLHGLPILLPGESRGQMSLAGYSQTQGVRHNWVTDIDSFLAQPWKTTQQRVIYLHKAVLLKLGYEKPCDKLSNSLNQNCTWWSSRMCTETVFPWKCDKIKCKFQTSL